MKFEGGGFICEVVLPDKSPVRSAVGQVCSQKLTAKRSAAFEACLELKKKGHIDGNLVSTFRKILPAMRNARLAFTTKNSIDYKMKLKPDLWDEGRGTIPQKLFATVLSVRDSQAMEFPPRPMVLFTRIPLPDFPSFPIYTRPSSSSFVDSKAIKYPIDMDLQSLGKLNKFTLLLLFDVFNKEYESNLESMTYWLAPFVESPQQAAGIGLVDWALVDHICESPDSKWSADDPPGKYLNRFLVDRWSGGIRYFSIAIDPRLRPIDPVPPDTPRHKFMDSILDFSVSLFAKSRQRAAWDLDQPVYKAHQMSNRLNWMEEFTEEQTSTHTQAWICVEPLKVSAVSCAVAAVGIS